MSTRRPVKGKVVAAYEDPDQARRAAERGREAGRGKARLRPPTKQDEIASLRSEMREEVKHTIVGPGNVGPFTKEMAREMRTLVPAATVVGALALAPFSFIPIGDWSLAFRLIVAVSVGAAAGATVGFVVGGGAKVREKEPGEMAAERGILVVAEAEDPEAVARTARAMAGEAIRVDVVSDEDEPVGEVATEETSDHPSGARRTRRAASEKAELLRERGPRKV